MNDNQRKSKEAEIWKAVTCAVCSEVYQEGTRDPLMLPCGHSFCRPCLDMLKRTDNFLCPICRQSHNNLYVDQLSVNYSLLSVSSACPDIEYDTCGDHGDARRYWCCDCDTPLCSLCLYSGHPQGHSVKLTETCIQEKKAALEGRLKSLDGYIEKHQEELRKTFIELFQGVQSLCQRNSALQDNRRSTTRVSEQIRKAKNIEGIRSSEEAVEQVFVKASKDVSDTKKETSKTSGLAGKLNTVGATAVEDTQKSSSVSQEGRASRSQLDLLDGRLVLHCFGGPTDPRLSLQLPSEVFLELSADDKCLGRVYIRLSNQLSRAQHFQALCLGSLGLSHLDFKGHTINTREGKCLSFCFQQNSDNDTSHNSDFNDYDWRSTYQQKPIREGMLMHLNRDDFPSSISPYRRLGYYSREEDYKYGNTSFGICLQSEPDRHCSCSFGEVVSGMEVVKSAVRHETNKITITQCGLVLPVIHPHPPPTSTLPHRPTRAGVEEFFRPPLPTRGKRGRLHR